MSNSWFKKQMGMYFAYHKNPYNCILHFVGVPLILLSVLVFLSKFSVLNINNLNISLGDFLFFSLLLLYLIFIPIMGFVSIVLYFPLYWFSQYIILGYLGNSLIIAIFCFVFGWALQFLGHVFEKRKPAFLDNALQVFMAPGFLVIELLVSAGFCRDLVIQLEQESETFKK